MVQTLIEIKYIFVLILDDLTHFPVNQNYFIMFITNGSSTTFIHNDQNYC